MAKEWEMIGKIRALRNQGLKPREIVKVLPVDIKVVYGVKATEKPVMIPARIHKPRIENDTVPDEAITLIGILNELKVISSTMNEQLALFRTLAKRGD